jgi:hypothetical protein
MQQVLAFRVILPYPLQAALDEALDVVLVEGGPQVELLGVVAVVVAYGCPPVNILFLLCRRF